MSFCTYSEHGVASRPWLAFWSKTASWKRAPRNVPKTNQDGTTLGPLPVLAASRLRTVRGLFILTASSTPSQRPLLCGFPWLAGCSLQRKPFRRGRWRWSASCTLKGPGASCSAGAARGEALRLHRRKERRHDPTNQMAPTRRAGSRGEGVENPKTRGILPKESGNSSETTPRRMLSNRIQIWWEWLWTCPRIHRVLMPNCGLLRSPHPAEEPVSGTQGDHAQNPSAHQLPDFEERQQEEQAALAGPSPFEANLVWQVATQALHAGIFPGAATLWLLPMSCSILPLQSPSCIEDHGLGKPRLPILNHCRRHLIDGVPPMQSWGREPVVNFIPSFLFINNLRLRGRCCPGCACPLGAKLTKISLSPAIKVLPTTVRAIRTWSSKRRLLCGNSQGTNASIQ